MPFNVATIKDKATSAKNATVTKFQDTRDRHSSTPMAKTRFAEGGYVPDARKAPPPPPPARSYNQASRPSLSASRSSLEDQADHRAPAPAHAQAPPPIARSTKPVLNRDTTATASPSPPPASPPGRMSSVMDRIKAFGGHSASPAPAPRSPVPPPPSRSQPKPKTEPVEIDSVDWTNLSPEDKQVFFAWLDEFFARFLNGAHDVHSGGKTIVPKVEERVSPPPAPPISNAMVVAGTKDEPKRKGAPPMLKSWSKPTLESPSSSSVHIPSDFTSSYPPPTTYGSQSLDLAYYFHPSTQWDDAWYSQPGAIPPPLQSNPHRLYKMQMMSRGDSRTTSICVLFSDLSAAWVTVSFSSSTSRITERTARYLPPPDTLPQDTLIVGSEMYGEHIASFAESFLGSGQFCGRGECWDLASEALKSFATEPSYPTPVQSLGRTHGHLIFVGRATKQGAGSARQMGRWRGGDDRVRRGDIVEWRSVRIALVDGPPGGYATLGDPEHTAVITRDAIPAAYVYDGASVEPRALSALEVVEQSTNSPPEPVKRTYDLQRFEEGEVWIYRPISMEVYLGFEELECTPPASALSL